MSAYRRLLGGVIGVLLIILGVSVILTGRLSHAIYGFLAHYGEYRNFFGCVLGSGGVAVLWFVFKKT